MKLVEKLMVYKGQFGYSTLLKNQEDKLYVQVGFRKGQEPFPGRKCDRFLPSRETH